MTGKRGEKKQYPNADHIPDRPIGSRLLYRRVERMAGMQVPQYDRDPFGEPVARPEPKPSDIYAHILKCIEELARKAVNKDDDYFEPKPLTPFEQLWSCLISWLTGNCPCTCGSCRMLRRTANKYRKHQRTHHA